MHQELSEDGFFRRVQLDTALKALYTSSEGLSHTVEGDREEGGDRSDAMDIAEPSAHAQARIRRVIDVRLHLHYVLSVIVFAQFTHRDFLSLLDPPPLDSTLLFVSHDHLQVRDEGQVSHNTGEHSDGGW